MSSASEVQHGLVAAARSEMTRTASVELHNQGRARSSEARNSSEGTQYRSDETTIRDHARSRRSVWKVSTGAFIRRPGAPQLESRHRIEVRTFSFPVSCLRELGRRRLDSRGRRRAGTQPPLVPEKPHPECQGASPTPREKPLMIRLQRATSVGTGGKAIQAEPRAVPATVCGPTSKPSAT